MTGPTERHAAENALAERASGYWLLAAAVVVLLPHVERFPLWLTATLAALFGWRFFMLRRGWPAPNRWLRWGLTLLLVTLLWRQYGTLLGRDAGSALLAAMLALKFLELQRLRDYVLGVLLIYFLILIGFLYSQALWLVAYLLAVFVLSTATLVRLAVPGARARFALRLATVLLLQALPLMLVMHLLFPRLPGSLWGLPRDAYAGLTGLSEDMRPGSINELSLSEDIAFRAHFAGPVPAPTVRYWRALVLWSTDGQVWTRGVEPPSELAYDSDSPALAYTLTVEPSNQPWLPALDLPAAAPPGTRLRSGFVLQAQRPIRERLQFDMQSHTRWRVRTLHDAERRHGLQLPRQSSERVRALAGQWRARARTDGDVVQAALRHFREQEFFYTLQPPLLGDDPVDEFLFDSRRGFCEHYAAAFVVLMRHAGVPARVVTGYQGGELNPAGNYLIVRQSDAHAWAEVWLTGSGWVRVDPTAAVAPERIDYGADGLRRLLERGVTLGGLAPEALQGLLSPDWFERVRRQARLSWDTVNTAWARWVLGYDRDRQRELLARLGFDEIQPARLLGLLALLVAALLAVYALVTARRAPRPDPVQRAYRLLCRRLARTGLTRAAHEGPLAFAARVSDARPELAAPLQTLTADYLRLRYGEAAPTDEQQRFARAVRAFRPTGYRR